MFTSNPAAHSAVAVNTNRNCSHFTVSLSSEGVKGTHSDYSSYSPSTQPVICDSTRLDNRVMYPLGGSPYSIPAPGQNMANNSSPNLPSYPRFMPNTCSNQQTGNTPIFPQANAMFLPNPLMSARSTLASSFATFPSAPPGLSPQSFYPMPQSMDSELASPVDPISPHDTLRTDNHDDVAEEPQSNYLDMCSFHSPSKSRTFTSGTPYLPPSSFSFPVSASTCSTMYSPSSNPLYNCPDSTLTLPNGVSPLSNPSWSAYPSLPCMTSPVNTSTVTSSRLSYDSPRFKLTPERAVPLIKWFEEHKEHPYPTRHEKILLCQSTQLTFTQVSTWFANARRRMKKATLEDDDSKNGSSSDYADSPKSTNDSTEMVTKTSFSSTVSVCDDFETGSDQGSVMSRQLKKGATDMEMWNNAVF